jgi:hypothetical protein
MSQRRLLLAAAVVVALVLVTVHLAQAARSLPGVFPGDDVH